MSVRRPTLSPVFAPIRSVRAASARALRWSRQSRAPDWLSIAALLMAIDFVTGPFIKFPITFIVPVGFAAWYGGARAGYVLAVLLPLGRLWFEDRWFVDQSGWEFASTGVIRVLVLSSFAFVIADLADKRRRLAERVEVLEGILPICSFCKKIRDDEGRWQPVERYVSGRTRASFSHGFCEECMARHYGVTRDDLEEPSAHRREKGVE